MISFKLFISFVRPKEMNQRKGRHFRVALAPQIIEFWDKATVLKLAARAYSKQYCLTPSEVSGELYCVGKLKNRSPKII